MIPCSSPFQYMQVNLQSRHGVANQSQGCKVLSITNKNILRGFPMAPCLEVKLEAQKRMTKTFARFCVAMEKHDSFNFKC